MIFSCDKLRISYEIYGSGEPLLFVHGLPLDSRVWHPILPKISARYQCILIDLPGFGRSKTRADGEIRFSQMKDALHALMCKLCVDRFGLLGHSFGGYVALDYFVSYRDSVSKLFLVSTKALADNEAKKNERIQYANQLVHKKYEDYYQLQASGCQVKEEYREILSQIMRDNITWHIASVLRTTAERQSIFPSLSPIDIPVTLIVGENDQSFLPDMMRLHQEIKSSRFEVIPGAGHMPYLDAEEHFAGIINDLSS